MTSSAERENSAISSREYYLKHLFLGTNRAAAMLWVSMLAAATLAAGPAAVAQAAAAVSPAFRWTDVITIVALVVGPLLAVWVGQTLQRRAFLRSRKDGIFTTLMATRKELIHPDHFRALAQIDVAFRDAPEVRNRWGTYYDNLNNPAYSNDAGASIRQNALYDMLTAMAADLKYKTIGYREVTRAYAPQGVADEMKAQRALRDEATRVFANTEYIGVQRVNGATPIRPPAVNLPTPPAGMPP